MTVCVHPPGGLPLEPQIQLEKRSSRATAVSKELLAAKLSLEGNHGVEPLAKICLDDKCVIALQEVTAEALACDPTLQLLSKIKTLWEAIYHATRLRTFEKEPLSKEEAFKTAYFCHTAIKKIAADHPEEVCHYVSSKSEPIARPIIYDSENEIVYLSSLYKKSARTGVGAHKKIVRALAFSLTGSIPPTLVCRSFTKKDISNESLEQARQEGFILSEMKGQKGVLQLYTLCSHATPLGLKERITMVMESFSRDIVEAIYSKVLTIEHKLQIAKCIIYGLFSVHQKGYMHGDIKLINILCRFTGDILSPKCIAKIADFGAAVKDGEPAGDLYNIGVYGTSAYTAPELLGVQNYQGDRKKVDLFALGICLYSLFFEKEIGWYSDISQYIKAWQEVRAWQSMCAEWQKYQAKFPSHRTPKIRLAFCLEQVKAAQEKCAHLREDIVKKIQNVALDIQSLDAKITLHKQKLEKGQTLEICETFEYVQWLILHLLDVHPDTRFDTAKIKAEIDTLLPDVEVE